MNTNQKSIVFRHLENARTIWEDQDLLSYFYIHFKVKHILLEKYNVQIGDSI